MGNVCCGGRRKGRIRPGDIEEGRHLLDRADGRVTEDVRYGSDGMEAAGIATAAPHAPAAITRRGMRPSSSNGHQDFVLVLIDGDGLIVKLFLAACGGGLNSSSLRCI